MNIKDVVEMKLKADQLDKDVVKYLRAGVIKYANFIRERMRELGLDEVQVTGKLESEEDETTPGTVEVRDGIEFPVAPLFELDFRADYFGVYCEDVREFKECNACNGTGSVKLGKPEIGYSCPKCQGGGRMSVLTGFKFTPRKYTLREISVTGSGEKDITLKFESSGSYAYVVDIVTMEVKKGNRDLDRNSHPRRMYATYNECKRACERAYEEAKGELK